MGFLVVWMSSFAGDSGRDSTKKNRHRQDRYRDLKLCNPGRRGGLLQEDLKINRRWFVDLGDGVCCHGRRRGGLTLEPELGPFLTWTDQIGASGRPLQALWETAQAKNRPPVWESSRRSLALAHRVPALTLLSTHARPNSTLKAQHVKRHRSKSTKSCFQQIAATARSKLQARLRTTMAAFLSRSE